MCEDFPCCGHDICPDFDEDGKQLNMRCTCGAAVPLGSSSSLCRGCLFQLCDNDAFPLDEDY